MSHEKPSYDERLTDAEAAALDADLALLMQHDPAPTLSASLSARILADAADAGYVAPVAPPAHHVSERPQASIGAAFVRFWQPLSAGLAAAALGLWLGWSDPAGVSLYAESFVLADLADLDGEIAEAADHFDLEL